MKRILSSVLIVLIIISFCSAADAAGNKSAVSKIERGSKNAALGWTEIPKSVLDTTKEKNIIVGLTVGLLEGVLNAFARTASGIADVATAPLGTYDKPAIKPEMVAGNK